MLRSLLDEPTPAYVVLGVGLLVSAALWWRDRRRGELWAVGAFALALLGLIAAGVLIDTDAKRIDRVLRDMARATQDRDVGRIFSHVSETFAVAGMDKLEFRRLVERRIGEVESFSLWDYQARDISRAERRAVVTFALKAHGQSWQAPFYRCRATFVLDPDGQWRLLNFDLFPPQSDPMTAPPIELPIRR